MKQSLGKARAQKTVRCSISFSAEHYHEMERIAAEKKVSLAWVVRDALERYLVEQKKAPGR